MRAYFTCFGFALLLLGIGVFVMWETDNHFMGTVVNKEKIGVAPMQAEYYLQVQFHEPNIKTIEKVNEETYKAYDKHDEIEMTLDHVPGQTIYFCIIYTTAMLVILAMMILGGIVWGVLSLIYD